jgi:hypothetical protein
MLVTIYILVDGNITNIFFLSSISQLLPLRLLSSNVFLQTLITFTPYKHVKSGEFRRSTGSTFNKGLDT